MLLLTAAHAFATGVALDAGLDADTFALSPGPLDGQGTLQLMDPQLGWPGGWYAGLGLVYSHNPVAYHFADGTREVLVSDQFSTRLAGGVDVRSVARIHVEAPLYPLNTVHASSEFALGELRVVGVLPLVRYEGDGVGVAVAPFVLAPTATAGAWVGSGGLRGGATGMLGGQAGGFGWVLNLGSTLGAEAESTNTTLGSELDAGGGFSVQVAEPFLLGLEATSRVNLAGTVAYNTIPTEAHLYGTWDRGQGFTLTVGGGTGLVPGVGAPDWRALAVTGWHVPGKEPIKDVDFDGILDDVDRCIDRPEDKDQFEDDDGCPDPDNDRDGVADTQDECPNDAEDKDRFEDDDGCPDPDNDSDGLLDEEDACPNAWGGEALRGCPDKDLDGITDLQDACPDEKGSVEAEGCPDRDNDRVPDRADACPDEPADPDIDPKRSDGCPSKVVVTQNQIKILDRIFFDTGKATIKPISDPLLGEIAKVLNAYPDIRHVEVGGHTDDVGADAKNLVLSQDRAQAVVTWLVTRGGVDASRLTARGYGEAKPIDSNSTEIGRAKNRRVEFSIVEQ
jgi:outer membrane protein OmpA-like peptidoglycan-associated protein